MQAGEELLDVWRGVEGGCHCASILLYGVYQSIYFSLLVVEFSWINKKMFVCLSSYLFEVTHL